MKVGIELIQQERNEQIEKHGYSSEHDAAYTNGELLRAADYCMQPRSGVWPAGWRTYPKYKIEKKDRIGQLMCAGAFYMAENDRLGSNQYQDKIEAIAADIDRLIADNPTLAQLHDVQIPKLIPLETWQDIKDFANSLTTEELKSAPIVWGEERGFKLEYASQLEEDYKNDGEFWSPASSCDDPDCWDEDIDPLPKGTPILHIDMDAAEAAQ